MEFEIEENTEANKMLFGRYDTTYGTSFGLRIEENALGNMLHFYYNSSDILIGFAIPGEFYSIDVDFANHKLNVVSPDGENEYDLPAQSLSSNNELIIFGDYEGTGGFYFIYPGAKFKLMNLSVNGDGWYPAKNMEAESGPKTGINNTGESIVGDYLGTGREFKVPEVVEYTYVPCRRIITVNPEIEPSSDGCAIIIPPFIKRSSSIFEVVERIHISNISSNETFTFFYEGYDDTHFFRGIIDEGNFKLEVHDGENSLIRTIVPAGTYTVELTMKFNGDNLKIEAEGMTVFNETNALFGTAAGWCSGKISIFASGQPENTLYDFFSGTLEFINIISGTDEYSFEATVRLPDEVAGVYEEANDLFLYSSETTNNFEYAYPELKYNLIANEFGNIDPEGEYISDEPVIQVDCLANEGYVLSTVKRNGVEILWPDTQHALIDISHSDSFDEDTFEFIFESGHGEGNIAHISTEGEGTVEPEGDVEYESTLNVLCTPSEGKIVWKVLINGAVEFEPRSSEPYTFLLKPDTGDDEVLVVFSDPIVYQVLIQKQGSGTVSPAGLYTPEEEPFRIVCTPAEGKVVSKIIVNGVVVDTPMIQGPYDYWHMHTSGLDYDEIMVVFEDAQSFYPPDMGRVVSIAREFGLEW